jgi:hypothetical protein
MPLLARLSLAPPAYSGCPGKLAASTRLTSFMFRLPFPSSSCRGPYTSSRFDFGPKVPCHRMKASSFIALCFFLDLSDLTRGMFWLPPTRELAVHAPLGLFLIGYLYFQGPGSYLLLHVCWMNCFGVGTATFGPLLRECLVDISSVDDFSAIYFSTTIICSSCETASQHEPTPLSLPRCLGTASSYR